MTAIDTILNGMEVEDYFHDPVQFSIDGNLRIISVPENGVVIGVVGDKDVNRINFMMPRYYNGIDMSVFNAQIDYSTPNGSVGYYDVDDMMVANGYILFTWLVGVDVTLYSGTVKFIVKMTKTESSVITQCFNTTLARGTILPGLSIDSIIEAERIRLLEKSEFGRLVCFTDSIGQGQNNDNYSYIDLLSESDRFVSVTKAAVGSATFGPYVGAENHAVLQYAVGASFYEQVRKPQYQTDITNADNIIVQYMANDVLAILADYVQIGTPSDTGTTTICGMVKSTLDYIYNLNPDVIITWISLFNSEKNVTYYATAYKSMSDTYNLGHTYTQIYNTAIALNSAMKTIFTNYNCNIMPILEGKPFNAINSDAFFSSDNVHPNLIGHKIIAKQFLKTLRGGQEISWNEINQVISGVSAGGSVEPSTPSDPIQASDIIKTFTMTMTAADYTSGTTDVTMAQLLSWHDAGYVIRGIAVFQGIDLIFNVATVFASSNYITLSTNVMMSNETGTALIFAAEIYANNVFGNFKAYNVASLDIPMSTVVSAMTS